MSHGASMLILQAVELSSHRCERVDYQRLRQVSTGVVIATCVLAPREAIARHITQLALAGCLLDLLGTSMQNDGR